MLGPVASVSSPRRLTDDEWGQLDEDEPGELVDGRLEEEEMPDVIHEVIASWFVVALGPWLLARGGTIGGAARFLIRPGLGRKSDVFIYLPGSRKPRQRGATRRPPDIIIEVLSPTPRDARRDRIDKFDDYAQFGVRWYWIVDPVGRTLEMFERGTDGAYQRLRAFADGTVSDVPECAGLTLNLDSLWRMVDELPLDEDPPE